jgi:hypothetical protein
MEELKKMIASKQQMEKEIEDLQTFLNSKGNFFFFFPSDHFSHSLFPLPLVSPFHCSRAPNKKIYLAGFGVSGNLVDKEGFPIGDVETIISVRQAR